MAPESETSDRRAGPTIRLDVLRAALVAAVLAAPALLSLFEGDGSFALGVVAFAAILGLSIGLLSALERRGVASPVGLALLGLGIATVAFTCAAAQAIYTTRAASGGPAAAVAAVDRAARDPDLRAQVVGLGLVGWGVPCGVLLLSRAEWPARGPRRWRDVCVDSLLLVVACLPTAALLNVLFAAAEALDRRLERPA
jgi:hypothetical protein